MGNAAALLARLLFAQLFLVAGIGKITHYAGTQAYMHAHGVPTALLPLVILLEVGGSLALIVGFFTRWIALAFVVFCVLAGWLFHFPDQVVIFQKDLAIAGGFVILAIAGAGRWSWDGKR